MAQQTRAVPEAPPARPEQASRWQRGRPRLSVHRSNKNISVQLIDDARGVTLASASSLERTLGVVGKNNVEAAAKVGAAIAERAKKAGVEASIFDRGGFLFHGRSRRWPMPRAKAV
jgi:ribosomal protein L18